MAPKRCNAAAVNHIIVIGEQWIDQLAGPTAGPPQTSPLAYATRPLWIMLVVVDDYEQKATLELHKQTTLIS